MSLSCSCDSDYDWYYEVYDAEYVAAVPFRCYGCGKRFPLATEVRLLAEYELDEDGEEGEHTIQGRLCPACSGLYDSLNELGFCLEADQGFITEAMHDYRENYT